MAAQMAQLLTGSDLLELKEVVRRWVTDAPTPRVAQQYQVFGDKLLELKRMLADAPTEPTRAELELALTMMLKLAAQHGGGGMFGA